MDFESSMAKIAESENGDEIITAIKARLQQVNNEAKNLRIKKKDAELERDNALNKKNPVLEELTNFGFNADSEDVAGSLKEFIASLKETKENDYSKDPRFIKQQKQIETLIKKSEDAEAEKMKLAIENKRSRIENELMSAFSSDIMNGKKVLNYAVKDSNSPFIIDDNNKVGFKLPDGDVITGVDEIMTEYKKMNPGEILNKQKSGTNGGVNNSVYSAPKEINSIDQIKRMTDKQLAALPKAQQKQVQDVITANSKK